MPPRCCRKTPAAPAAPKDNGSNNEVGEAAEQLAELGVPVNKAAPEIPWRDSEAGALLRQDMLDNVVPK